MTSFVGSSPFLTLRVGPRQFRVEAVGDGASADEVPS